MGKRCVIYSSGEGLETKKKIPVKVLACFGHLGHGIVYDNYSNIRFVESFLSTTYLLYFDHIILHGFFVISSNSILFFL